MNISTVLSQSEQFNPLYLEHIEEKARASSRRKAKFVPVSEPAKRRHWPNRTGAYIDKEFMRGPKFWNTKGQQTRAVKSTIETYRDLTIAINLISAGEKQAHEYREVTGINRFRLKLAQSWKDKGKEYSPRDIFRLSETEMKIELGFGYER